MEKLYFLIGIVAVLCITLVNANNLSADWNKTLESFYASRDVNNISLEDQNELREINNYYILQERNKDLENTTYEEYQLELEQQSLEPYDDSDLTLFYLLGILCIVIIIIFLIIKVS